MTVLGLWIYGGILSLIAFPLIIKTHYRPYIFVAFTWFLVNSAFFTVWQPSYFVFRIPAIIAATVFLSIIATHYRAKRFGIVWLFGIGIWCGLQGACNYALSINPHLEEGANPYLIFAEDFRKHSAPNDMLVLSGTYYSENDEVYVPYFAKRAVYSLHTEMAHHNENFAAIQADFARKLAQVEAKGGRAYVMDNLYYPGITLNVLQKQHHISQNMVMNLFAGHKRQRVWKTRSGENVWMLSPIPPQSAIATKTAPTALPVRPRKAAPTSVLQKDAHSHPKV
jgi:hypothetical protein